MSEFSNPFEGGTAPNAAEAYICALLDLLGDRDPLKVQGETVAALRQSIAGVSGADLQRLESEGKWSILQVVHHLADSEIVGGYRLRLTVAEDEPPIPGYDQDRWAERLHRNEGSASRAIDMLESIRRANHDFLGALPRSEWERAGSHSERGRETVEQLVNLLAAHDLVHLRQIERIKRTLGI